MEPAELAHLTTPVLAGTQAMPAAGQIDPADSNYTGPRLPWMANLLGGLLFGFGMVFAGRCGSKLLVRAGGLDAGLADARQRREPAYSPVPPRRHSRCATFAGKALPIPATPRATWSPPR